MCFVSDPKCVGLNKNKSDNNQGVCLYFFASFLVFLLFYFDRFDSICQNTETIVKLFLHFDVFKDR